MYHVVEIKGRECSNYHMNLRRISLTFKLLKQDSVIAVVDDVLPTFLAKLFVTRRRAKSIHTALAQFFDSLRMI